MRNRIFPILTLFFLLAGITRTRAQDMVGCTQLLEDAREAYAAGMVELVPELLLPCIESGLVGDLRVEAYKLVINAYLFDYLPDQADLLMSDFLDENPEYVVSPSDTEEFKLLCETQKKRRSEEAATLAAQERLRQQAELEKRLREEEAQKQQKRESKDGSINTQSPRMGLVLGYSSTITQVTEPFSTGDPMLDGGDFSSKPGVVLGGVADFPLGRVTEIGVELLYNWARIDYAASPNSNTSFTSSESQSWLQLPLSLALYLNPKNKARVYMRFGVVSNYLLAASVTATRSYTSTGSSAVPDVEMESTAITDTRARMNLHGMAGIGIKFSWKSAFFFVEGRYLEGLFQANREELRYDNQELLWLIYHVDSDFKLHQINISAGLVFNLK
jgi:hypothetical protein